ncbi:MAG: class I SAM-dependent methyltransferase [Thermoproteota archaeon]
MPEWDHKRSIMQRYDITAEMYDRRYSKEQTSKIEAVIQNAKMEDSLVLDLGCGTGFLFQYVANKAKATVALDLSRRNLIQAKERAKKFANIHLVLGDADHLPLKTGIFSHLYAITLLQNMPEPIKTLEEARRVVESGGLIAVTGLKKKFTQESFEGLIRCSGLNCMFIENDLLNCWAAVYTV